MPDDTKVEPEVVVRLKDDKAGRGVGTVIKVDGSKALVCFLFFLPMEVLVSDLEIIHPHRIRVRICDEGGCFCPTSSHSEDCPHWSVG